MPAGAETCPRCDKNPDIQYFNLGSCRVSLVGQEHYGYHYPELESYFDSNTPDVVFLEYFLPDIFRPINPTLTKAGAWVYLQTGAAQLSDCVAERVRGQKIVVADPANNLHFVIRELAGPLTLTYTGMKIISEKGSRISRRQFLAGLSSLALGAAISPATSVINKPRLFNGEDMRRVTVASGLVKYCQKASQALNIAVIYPPGHVDGIVWYLKNPSERIIRQGIYSRAWPGFIPTIRGYSFCPKKNTWQLETDYPIT